MCEGVGIRTNDLYPHLNNKKCIAVLKQQMGRDFSLENEEDFDIDDYFYGEPFENLADFLCHCDDTNTMTYEGNGDGDCFFYYAPSYPWSRKEMNLCH